MRALLVFGLIVVLAAVVAMQLLDDGAVAPVPGGGSHERGDAVPTTATAAGSVPPGTSATHVEREPVAATGLADAPTACLRVVDHADGRPVEGAAVRRVRDGAEVAFTDDRGLAPVPLRSFEQLAVVRDGYLLRLAPTRPGSTEADPQVVRLVGDTWSPRVRLAFAAPDGARPAEVFVRFRADRAAAVPPPPVPDGDAVLQRAWTEHAMLAGRPVCGDVAVELGTFAPDRVHRLVAGADVEVRFVVPGAYTLEAATITGLVARQPLPVGATGAPQRVTVELQPGGEIVGVVRDTNGGPLAGARVTVQGSDPLGLVATTAADGAFRLGPLARSPVTLHVQHGDHEPRAVAAVPVPAANVVVALQPLPASALRGRVRLRPDGTPLAGATVAWQPDGRTAAAVRTGDDGTFVLRTTGTGPARLAITAPGCQPYAELIEPGAPFQDFDVWPGTTEARLDAGLTAVLAGVVLDANGRPRAGATVRWQPATEAPPPAGVPGRRVLEGAVLQLPSVTATAADGSFVLETTHVGAGRLALADRDGAAIETEARAGATVDGLVLRR